MEDDLIGAWLDQRRCHAETSHVPAGVSGRCQLYGGHGEVAHALQWRDQDGRRIARTWHDDAAGTIDLQPDMWGDLPIRFPWSAGMGPVWSEPPRSQRRREPIGPAKRRRR